MPCKEEMTEWSGPRRQRGIENGGATTQPSPSKVRAGHVRPEFQTRRESGKLRDDTKWSAFLVLETDPHASNIL